MALYNKNLKYPLVFVHGMGFRDSKIINYWGRIPKMAQNMGCSVFFGQQDSNGSVETNAAQLKKSVEEILAKTGFEKVNIIAHSKGGLDARYMISSLNMGEKVASLTTISTPHNGSKTMDLLLKFPDFLVRFAAVLPDIFYRIIGDESPSSYKVFHLFSTDGAKEFNKNNPDCDKVYYQSYAFVMKHPFSDILMCFPNLVVKLIEGENDGLLTPEGATWTNFKGVYKGEGHRGISHCDEVDFRRRRLTGKRGENVSDVTELYQGIIEELIAMGF